MIWAAVLIGAAGTFSEKLLGYLLPGRLLENTSVRRITGYLPICLLSALVAVQTFSTGTTLEIDARLAGVGAAVVALMLKAPFLVVVLVAAAVAALLRASGVAS